MFSKSALIKIFLILFLNFNFIECNFYNYFNYRVPNQFFIYKYRFNPSNRAFTRFNFLNEINSEKVNDYFEVQHGADDVDNDNTEDTLEQDYQVENSNFKIESIAITKPNYVNSETRDVKEHANTNRTFLVLNDSKRNLSNFFTNRNRTFSVSAQISDSRESSAIFTLNTLLKINIVLILIVSVILFIYFLI